MRIRALGAILLLTLTLMTAGCGVDPTTPLPANLCDAVGTALITSLVPGVPPEHANESHGRFEFAGTCEAHSDFDHNDLRVRVQRYGKCHDVEDATFCHNNPAKDNKQNFDTQCSGRKRDAASLGAYSEPAGLGDAACQSLRQPHRISPTRMTADEVSVELLVRAGPDQLSVDYTGFGKALTPAQATAGARKVAEALLKSLKT